MSVRFGQEAARWFGEQVGKSEYHLMCKAFVRTGLNVVPSQSGTAIECFLEAKHKHLIHDPEWIPAFAPVFLDTSNTAEHVAFTVGRNRAGHRMVITTDGGPNNSVALVELVRLRDSWGPILGWTEDFDGQTVYVDKPSISLQNVADAARHEGDVGGDAPLHPRAVGYVERALVAESMLDPQFVNGRFGPRKRRAYARWQRKVDAIRDTGIPDLYSLDRLGRRNGFNVH